MKEKIKTVILIFVFIILIGGVSFYMKNTEVENNIQKFDSIEKSDDSINIIEVNEENFDEEVLKSNKKVLVDFYATWCGPCKMLHPILEEIAKEENDLKVIQIDVDQCEELAIKYNIRAMPTLVVLENGNEINRIVGLTEKEEVLNICGK